MRKIKKKWLKFENWVALNWLPIAMVLYVGFFVFMVAMNEHTPDPHIVDNPHWVKR